MTLLVGASTCWLAGCGPGAFGAGEGSTGASGTGGESSASDSGNGDGDGDESEGSEGMEEGAEQLPLPPDEVELSYAKIKKFNLSWSESQGADFYRILERVNPGGDYLPLAEIEEGQASSLVVPLHLRGTASYIVQACNAIGCADADPVEVMDSLASAIGYIKPFNPDPQDRFGTSLAISPDGRTLAVGAPYENSASQSEPGDNFSDDVGAVYIFEYDEATQSWSQQAYLKGSNSEEEDRFGGKLALSGSDPLILVVGASGEDSSARGVDGDQADNSSENSGAAYTFVRDSASGSWSQQAYLKSPNSDAEDYFGASVAISRDGQTLIISATGEDSEASTVDGESSNNASLDSGAAYVLRYDALAQTWTHAAYFKASNAGAGDRFGRSVDIDDGGSTIVVGASNEASLSAGVDGDQDDNSGDQIGAAYVFARDAMTQAWSQQAYIKPSNPQLAQVFGRAASISGDGNTLAVSAEQENGSSVGINGDDTLGMKFKSGAVYVFSRAPMSSSWSQQAYIKPLNNEVIDSFGYGLVLSNDGTYLVASSSHEDSSAPGVDGDRENNDFEGAGAAYVYRSNASPDGWEFVSYIKASNPGASDVFGSALAVSADGSTLAVAASSEGGGVPGLNGDESDDSLFYAGAVYLY